MNVCNKPIKYQYQKLQTSSPSSNLQLQAKLS